MQVLDHVPSSPAESRCISPPTAVATRPGTPLSHRPPQPMAVLPGLACAGYCPTLEIRSARPSFTPRKDSRPIPGPARQELPAWSRHGLLAGRFPRSGKPREDTSTCGAPRRSLPSTSRRPAPPVGAGQPLPDPVGDCTGTPRHGGRPWSLFPSAGLPWRPFAVTATASSLWLYYRRREPRNQRCRRASCSRISRPAQPERHAAKSDGSPAEPSGEQAS